MTIYGEDMIILRKLSTTRICLPNEVQIKFRIPLDSILYIQDFSSNLNIDNLVQFADNKTRQNIVADQLCYWSKIFSYI